MKIFPIDPTRKLDRQSFLNLPFQIYRNNPQWVPPLDVDARRQLNPRENPFFSHSQAAFLMAEDNGRFIGRLAILENRNYNDYNHETSAFFYLFECENDPDAAFGLFEAGSDWACNRNLNRIIGPKGFSALDGLGMLVEGFEHRPALGIPYNLPYYPRLVEAAGFTSMGESVSGYLDRNIVIPEKIHEVSRIVQEKKGLRISRFRTRKDLYRLVPQLRDLYNQAVEGTTGNTPLTDDEALTMADQMLWFADPRLIKIIYHEEEPVGFLFAYPDISEAIQRIGGKLLPFGWARLLLELRRTKWLNINGMGLIEKYRGMGGTALLFSEMYKTIRESRFEHIDVVQIAVDNERMQNEMRNFGIKFYKKHRIYEKKLDDLSV